MSQIDPTSSKPFDVTSNQILTNPDSASRVVLELNQEGKVIQAPLRFVDKIVHALPDWLRGGALEDWILQMGLDKATYQNRKNVVGAFRSSVAELISDEAIRTTLLGSVGQMISLEQRHIELLSSKEGTLDKILQQTAERAAQLDEFAKRCTADGISPLPNRHGLNLKINDLGADFREKSTTALNNESKDLIGKGGRESPDYITPSSQPTGLMEESFPILNSNALGVDLGRASIEIFDGPSSVLGLAESKAKDGVLRISQTLWNLFQDKALRHMPEPGQEMQALEDAQKALLDYSMMMHQGLYADAIIHEIENTRFGGISILDGQSEGQNTYKESVGQKIHFMPDGKVRVDAYVRKPIGIVQLPDNTRYYCDPSRSYREIRLQVEFTPAYLSKTIDDRPYFEVLSATYDRTLVPIQK